MLSIIDQYINKPMFFVLPSSLSSQTTNQEISEYSFQLLYMEAYTNTGNPKTLACIYIQITTVLMTIHEYFI